MHSQLCVNTLLCTLLLITTGSTIQVTGAKGGIDQSSRIRPFRREINELSQSGPSWDLYIQALRRFHDDTISNPLSYFQIAGIHGYPQRPWNDVVGKYTEGGFCMHNSVLFPVWHRPYLALYEQIISNHAQTIALEYGQELRSVYVNAASLLRIPYWDSARGPYFGLPSVVTTSTLLINTPRGLQNISNPLLQYNFPVNMLESNYFPAQFNISGLAFTTRHHDVALGQSNQTAASEQLVAESQQRLANLYELFSSINNYTTFSAYELAGQFNDNMNVDRIHGTIHNSIGGLYWQQPLGHMTVFWLSAFDPIFWLHHANVDRLIAMWQALYPDSYVEPTLNTKGTYFQAPGIVEDQNTPLAPFHSDSTSAMWTAATVRDTAVFGYTYPELVDWNVSASQLATNVRQSINELYNPLIQVPPKTNVTHVQLRKHSQSVAQALRNVHAGQALRLGVNNLEKQWYIRITISGAATSQGISAYFFIGRPPTDISTAYMAPNFIGTHAPDFLRSTPDDRPAGMQQTTISCTHTVAAAVERKLLAGLGPEVVVPFLKQHLTWKVVTKDGSEVDLESTSSIRISLLSRSVEPRKSISEFPLYGSLEEHAYIATGISSNIRDDGS